MKFIILGKTHLLTEKIHSCGGQVVASYNEDESVQLRNPEFELPKADYLLNVFSPHILKTHILNKFPGRALNVHNGKLPEYAGIHVHQWAIRNGETKTAVTVHYMATSIDTGDIIAERDIEIDQNATGLTLYIKTVKAGLILMSEIVELILNKTTLISWPQDINKRVIYRHKDALNSKIDWSKPAKEIRNFVRAGSYYPFNSPTYSATLLNKHYGEILVLNGIVENQTGKPGSLLNLNNKGPLIACGKHSLRLTKIHCKSFKELDWNNIFER